MPKYYYDCPIKAAYMAKEFGMQIGILEPANRVLAKTENMIVHGGDDFIEFTVDDLLNWGMSEHYCEWQFYIHPDSVGILEPVEGDLIKEEIGRFGTIDSIKIEIGEDYKRTDIYMDWDKKNDYTLDIEISEITQRNNKPFMWPLEEGE